MEKSPCYKIERQVSQMHALLGEPIMEEPEDTLINCTMPEMDRYDRVYLDSIPLYLL